MTLKHFKIKILAILTLTLSTHKVSSQIFDNIQAHPSIKWKQIDNPYFRLIFPESFEKKALILADSLHSYHGKSSRDLALNPKKISFILHANHIEQNGFVQLAPRKSELYPIPSASPDNQEWLPNLALHEYRHVAQFDKLTGKIKGPFFEQLALALFAINLPSWYFEGDATQIETIHSKGGRGRLPSWEMPLRANILSGRNYNFDKYVMGSFKDNVPSYYVIGYMMNSYLTNNFGVESHEKILESMRKNLIKPYNFQQALRATSALNSQQLYKKTTEYLAEKWTKEKPKNISETTKIALKKSPYPTNYLLPQIGEDNKIYSLKTSPQNTAQITRLSDNGEEKTIVKIGYQITPNFHIKANNIVWDEYKKHPRFGKETYNIINIHNIKTGKTKSLSSKTRYYFPSLHPFAEQIVTVEVDKSGYSSLIILDAQRGNIVEKIAAPQGMHLQQPKYNNAGTRIIAIAVAAQGTNLIEFDLASKDHKFLLNWGDQQLEQPFYEKERVIFKAHYNGIDNIYQLEEGTIKPLTQAEYGAFNPFIDQKGNLLYNDYQYNGYKISKKESTPVSDDRTVRPFYIQATLDSLNENTPYTLRDTALKISNYKPDTHLFNFHSLSISSNDFESFDNYVPGLFWLSNDLLNTTQMKIGAEYDTDINKTRYSAEISYRKFLPIFTLKYANRGQIGQAVKNNNDKELLPYSFRDHHINMEMNIPLSIYLKNQVYSYGFNMSSSYTKRYNPSISLKNFTDVIAFPIAYQVYFNRNNMRSKMDIMPKWGQNISVTYRHLPFENRLSGHIFSVRSNFYFPGLFKNHSIQFRLAFQESSGIYDYNYDIPLPTGWGHYNSPIVKNTSMINYSLPLLYPDWSIGSLTYIKRLQGLVFTDFQNIHQSLSPKSIGIGLSADLNIFRYPLPDINLASKLSYINDATTSRRIIPSFSISYTY